MIVSKEISEMNIKELLTKKKSGLIKGFISSKSGKKFDAYLLYENDKIKFDFTKR